MAKQQAFLAHSAQDADEAARIATGEAPYRGRLPFGVEHASIFHGRDEETGHLVGRLGARSFLTVVGEAGSGKSSLLNAGLIPALARGRFHEGRESPSRWKFLVVRPGVSPFAELAAELPELDSSSSEARKQELRSKCSDALRYGSKGILQCIVGLVPSKSRFLLVVDQFEELFTRTSDTGERMRFIDSLFFAARGHRDCPVHVLVSLRAEHFSECWAHPSLPERMLANSYPLRPVRGERLREIIELPLRIKGSSLEAGLTERILGDCGERPDRLATLQICLLRLWTAARGREISLAMYEDLGGLDGMTAEEPILPAVQGAEPRPPDGGSSADPPRNVLGEDEADQREVEEARQFADRSLREQKRDPLKGLLLAIEAVSRVASDKSVDILRASLLTATERAVLRQADRVIAAAFTPDGRNLMTAAADGSVSSWDVRCGRELSRLEIQGGLVGASFNAESVIILAADGSAQLWNLRKGQFVSRLLAPESRASFVLFSPDGARIIITCSDGNVWIFSGETWSEWTVLRGHEGAVDHASFSADGKRVVTAGADGTARIWDPSSRDLVTVIYGHERKIDFATFSRDGSLIVTASGDRNARVWDALRGEELVTLSGHTSKVWHASFSEDAERIVTSGQDNTARIWDTRSGAETCSLVGHGDWVRMALFSHDASRVLTASYDGTARIWDARTGREQTVLVGHEGNISHAGFSPDGSLVVTTSKDGSARIWASSSGYELGILEGHEAGVTHVEFAPGGRELLTAGDDATARIWDVPSGTGKAVLADHRNSIGVACFSGDGRRILTAGGDESCWVWKWPSGERLPGPLGGHSIRCAALGPLAERAVTAALDGSMRIWEAESGRLLTDVRVHAGRIEHAVFDPSGTRVLTASVDGTARVSDAATGAALLLLQGHEGAVQQAIYSHDGRLIMTSSKDGSARVWNAASGEWIATLLGHDGGITHIAFGPDGGQALTSSNDGTARIWDSHSGEVIAVLKGHEAGVQQAWLSPNGKLAVTASMDATARIWNAIDGSEKAVLRGHVGPVWAVRFSQDQRYIVTAGSDGTARIFVTEACDLLVVAEDRLPVTLTLDQRRELLLPG